MTVKKEKKASTKTTPARKVLETRNEKTGELTGSQSLEGKGNVPTAAPSNSSIKAVKVESERTSNVEKAYQILESNSYHRQAMFSSKFFLDYEQPGGFGGLPLFGYHEGHAVDKFANLLAKLDGIALEDLAKAVAPKIAGKDTTYTVYFRDLQVTATAWNLSRDLDTEQQKELVDYYNAHGINDRPRSSDDLLTFDDLTEFNKWYADWSFNYDNILPLPMSPKEKNVYLVAIEYASHVDLALRLRSKLSPTVYDIITTTWRQQVGALSPEDKDIHLGELPAFLRF